MMVFSKVKDDALFNIRFVQSVEKHPCLYNNTLAEYSRKDVSDIAWRTVAEEINESVPYCKEKWKNLRSVFVRTLKPLPGGGQKNRKPYYLNDAMHFLLPYIKSGPAVLEVSETVVSPFSCEDADDPLAFADSNQDDAELDIDNDSFRSNLDLRLSKKRKTYDSNEFEGHEHKDDLNPRKMFLLSLVPEVDELTEEQMRRFRRNVFQMIDNLKTHSSNIVESNQVFIPSNSFVRGECSTGATEFSESIQDQQNESGFQTVDRKPFRSTR